jgi:hypothetical protein
LHPDKTLRAIQIDLKAKNKQKEKSDEYPDRIDRGWTNGQSVCPDPGV